MSYRFIEGCCGTAAITFHLCGIKKPVLSYQGSKWKFRKILAAILEDHGYFGPPDQIELYDPGPWSRVIPILIKETAEIISILKRYRSVDPEIIFKLLHDQPVSQMDAQFAAEFLFLQRLSFSGKAVGCKDGIWKSPGFNKACAYGLPGTDRFGEVKPMLPSLIKTLEGFDFSKMPPMIAGSFLPKPLQPVERTVVYLDPPYQSSTKYPDGDLSRKELINLAQAWSNSGALVLISEAEPISELNWKTICLSGSRDIESGFKSKKEEWVTINS